MADIVDVLHNTGRLARRDQQVMIQRQVLIEAACEIARRRALVAQNERREAQDLTLGDLLRMEADGTPALVAADTPDGADS